MQERLLHNAPAIASGKATNFALIRGGKVYNMKRDNTQFDKFTDENVVMKGKVAGTTVQWIRSQHLNRREPRGDVPYADGDRSRSDDVIHDGLGDSLGADSRVLAFSNRPGRDFERRDEQLAAGQLAANRSSGMRSWNRIVFLLLCCRRLGSFHSLSAG
jgi:hypothetical protein